MLDWDTIYWIHVIELWSGVAGLVLILIYFCVKGLITLRKKQQEIKKLKLKQQGAQEREVLTTKDVEELKPCPFCGGKARIMLEEEDKPDDYFHNVYCTNCGCQFWVKSKSEALKLWNTRV